MTPRPLLVAAALIFAIAGALLAAGVLMAAPRSDLETLAALLSLSGGGSLLLAAAAVRWGGDRLGSLRLRLIVASGAGLLVAVATVAATAALMFLSSHDFSLLLLLLVFSAVVSLAFSSSVAGALTEDLRVLSGAAERLAGGELGTRLRPTGSDEVARLARTFDAMAQQLEQLFRRERELEASRRNLIAAVSHDLRTPLANAQAMVEAILDGVVADPAEVQRYLELIQGEVQHLGRLIDDLFELSQIEVGALRLQVAPIPLPELVWETVEAYRAQAQDQGLALESDAEPAMPPVEVDAGRIQRVLRNLIDNAQRHTPAGGTIRVEARREGANARVSVADDGPGLPAEELDRVFDAFYRAGGPSRDSALPGDRAAGVGLGLAIARGLVDAHGGRIWAEPRPGGGTVFSFTLPLAAPAS